MLRPGRVWKEQYNFDNEICLSHFTESEKPFPDWLPKSVHHSVYGCYRCQDVCPKNKGVLSTITEEVCFSEEETGMLLAGVKKEEMPEDLVEKIERLGMEDWRLQTLPKNLRALMDNAG